MINRTINKFNGNEYRDMKRYSRLSGQRELFVRNGLVEYDKLVQQSESSESFGRTVKMKVNPEGFFYIRAQGRDEGPKISCEREGFGGDTVSNERSGKGSCLKKVQGKSNRIERQGQRRSNKNKGNRKKGNNNIVDDKKADDKKADDKKADDKKADNKRRGGYNKRGRNNGRYGKKRRRFVRPDFTAEEIQNIPYTDAKLLGYFTSRFGKILPRRKTKLTSKQHKRITKLIKFARIQKVLTFIGKPVDPYLDD